ncbi:class I SAM-dependent methyltransferase [Neorhodopirellula pilleata]|uniref:Demethylmenaquinone methyltransferase n=1 Tax=Neorhodopirellula pilleata TaxID=2714738 RepID=A0A5C5ZZS8_9BACT|nr:class I SAM-dependent methyltransferase [Neorhodopirellula pilleata]TWT92531.1 Demethylmenaquinone methyltransferase [Neorhodopirellula pilleata]
MSAAAKASSRWSDLKILWHLTMSPVRGNTHAQRLESFYSGQAENYDAFRARMLHGRRELIASIDFPPGGVWVDLGAGTGENVLAAGERAGQLSEIHLVDLSPSLLAVAPRNAARAGVDCVHTHLADATRFEREPESVDVVTCSYSLTMIPDWFEALAAAERMLRPGGTIAVVDFYVSRKYATEGMKQHGWLRRAFWTHWFAADNVHLTGDHIAMLHRRFEVQRFEERFGKIPYLPLVRAPYYQFVGTKPGGSSLAGVLI